MNRIKHPRPAGHPIARALAIAAAGWLGAGPVAVAAMITPDVDSPDGVVATSPPSGPAGSSHWNTMVMLDNWPSVAASNPVNEAGTATPAGVVNYVRFPGPLADASGKITFHACDGSLVISGIQLVDAVPATVSLAPSGLAATPGNSQVAVSSALNATVGAAQQVVAAIASDDAIPPIPLGPGQRGTVACIESPAISYDIYLPSNYSATGTPLPILYTFNPSGGGMVADFKSVCANLQIIVVGVTGSKNLVPWDVVLREVYAVTRDIRQRLVFDPTAEMASGMSGGGWVSYAFSRYRPQQVAGIFPMGGWMGHTDFVYPTTDRVQYNLLVARAAGNTDTGANYYLSGDRNFLTSCGAVVNDWSFTGGHVVAPDNIKTAALTWILANRTPAGPNDRNTAQAQASDWQARIAAGDRQTVLYEAVYALMNQPRSWFAYQAQLILDQLLGNAGFGALEVLDVARGDFANNHFYYAARGAALNGDLQTYRGAMKALTGIQAVYGDRSGGIYTMLEQYGFVTPVLGISQDSGQLGLALRKDTPGLSYALEISANLGSGTWQELSESVVETNTLWSAGFELPADAPCGFYRIRATPTPSTAEEWP